MKTNLYRAVTRLPALEINTYNRIMSVNIHWYYAEQRGTSIQEEYNAFAIRPASLQRTVIAHNVANGLLLDDEVNKLRAYLTENLHWPIELVEHVPGVGVDDYQLQLPRADRIYSAVGDQQQFLYAFAAVGPHYLLYRHKDYSMPYRVAGLIRGAYDWSLHELPEELCPYDGIADPLWDKS